MSELAPQVVCWWPVFWWPWLQLLQGVVSTSGVCRGLPQETLASQPVELAGCLILVRRWTLPSWFKLYIAHLVDGTANMSLSFWHSRVRGSSVCWSSHLTSLLLFYWRGVTEPLVSCSRRSFSSSPSFQTLSRPLTGQRRLPEPSSSLGRHLRFPASREPVGLRCFGTVDSLFVLKPELSLTQVAFCWWLSRSFPTQLSRLNNQGIDSFLPEQGK